MKHTERTRCPKETQPHHQLPPTSLTLLWPMVLLNAQQSLGLPTQCQTHAPARTHAHTHRDTLTHTHTNTHTHAHMLTEEQALTKNTHTSTHMDTYTHTDLQPTGGADSTVKV
jgi:hypothetical protein